ncbi:MAG: oligosaccharide flippase family protein [candidate division WOR-3 bacterium]|nr:MAG: oligosaccharide flippase family protein [candidate division WOR-3 bacterium]
MIQKNNLAQKLILGYGSRIAIQFIQVVASIVVARVAGPTVLGTVAFGLAFVSIFEFIADLGIGTAHLKLVSEGQDMGTCISTYSVLKMITTFLYFIVVFGLYLIQKLVFNVQFESTAHEYVIIILLVTVTINQLLRIPKATFAGKTEQAKQSIPEFVRILIYQIFRIIIVLLGYKAVALALGNLAATILVIPLVLYLFKDYPRAKFDWQLALRYLKISLPLIVIEMSAKVMHHIDKLALQHFADSEQLGYYTAGYRIGGIVFMMETSVGIIFLPLFSKAAADGNFQYIKTTTEKFERFCFLIVMPVVIFLSLYSDIIIKLFLGSQYVPSIPIMAVINLAMFVMVLNIPYSSVITGMGFFRLAAFLSLINLILFVSLIYIFPNPDIVGLGAVGAAYAILFSSVFSGISHRFFAKQKCSILDLTKNIKFMLFGIINVIAFYFIYKYFSLMYGIHFKIVFVPLYFGITYLVLFFLGWITKEDVYNMKELINMRKLGSYIKNEMRNKSGHDTEL